MGVSALALAFGPSVALAQTSGGEAEVEELVITGQRAAIASAQVIKQEATQIVDSITATDIGALPDRSVTEALQRVPGVTIGRTTEPRDADRLTAEGSGVQIRGLNWVRSELNGRDSFSARNGRGLSFEDVPPELMAGVDVYKNPSADIIEGGVGGTVNLRTRLPFDSSKRLIAISGDMSYGDMRKKWEPSVSGLFSDRWDTPIGEVGLLLNASDSRLSGRQDTMSVDPFFARTNLVPGQTVYVPGGFGYRRLDNDRKRQGLAAALQWRPNDQWETSFQYLMSKATLATGENVVGFNPGSGNGPAAGTSFTYNSSGFFQRGTLASSPGGTGLGASVLDARYNERTSTTSDYSLNTKYEPNEKWSFSGDLQYIRAKTKAYDFTSFLAIGQDAAPATLDLSGRHPVITMNNDPAFFHNPANYYLLAAMDYHDYNTAEQWSERLDGKYTFDEGSWLKDVRFGVRATQRRAATRATNFNWGAVAPQWAGGRSLAATPSLQGYYSLFEFDDYYRGDVQLPGTFILPTLSLVKDFDEGAAIITPLAVASAGGTGGGWRPFNGDFGAAAARGQGSLNYQKEKTYAGYAVLNFGNPIMFAGEERELDGNVGVRIVRTDATSIGSQAFSRPGFAGGLPPGDQAFLNNARSEFIGGREYWNVLPSLNLRLKLTPEVYLRFAAAKAMVRPDFGQMQPTFNINATGGSLAGGACTSAVPTGGQPNCVFRYTAFAGNPDLKPTRSTQFDASLEWYFAPAGSFSFTVFHKDIYNFITNGVFNREFTNNGVTRTVLVTQPYNAGHGTVKGFEAAYQQYFDFLPSFWQGLGVQANFTYVDSQGGRNAAANPFDQTQINNAELTADDLPLEALSRTAYNVALLYDYGKVSARLAYNWRERYLLTTSAANMNIPAWYDNYGQLDGSVFYSVTENVKVGVQGVNLLNSESRILVSYPGSPHLGKSYHNWVTTDRRYSVVLRATF